MAGSWLVVLPSGSGTSRCQRAPKASRARSRCAAPISVTPNGMPSGRKPAGSARAQSPKKFTKLV